MNCEKPKTPFYHKNNDHWAAKSRMPTLLHSSQKIKSMGPCNTSSAF